MIILPSGETISVAEILRNTKGPSLPTKPCARCGDERRPKMWSYVGGEGVVCRSLRDCRDSVRAMDAEAVLDGVNDGKERAIAVEGR